MKQRLSLQCQLDETGRMKNLLLSMEVTSGKVLYSEDREKLRRTLPKRRRRLSHNFFLLLLLLLFFK